MSMGAEEGQKNQLSGESPKEVGFQSHKVASKFFGSKEAIAQEVDDIFHNTFPHFFAPGSGHRIAYNPYESMLVKATETLGLDPALELAFLMRESSTEIFEARRAEKREDEPFDNLFQVVGDIRGEADNNSRQPLGILGSGPKDILYVNLELGPKIHLPKVNPNYCSCEEHPYPMCDGDFCQDHNADIIEGYHFPDAHILCGGEMLAHAECITNTIKGIYEKEVGLFPETGDASIEFVTKRLGKIVPYIAELSVLQAVLFVRQEKRDMDHCILLDDMDASSITRGCFRTTRDIVVCTRSRCSQYNTQRHLRGQKYAHCNDRFSCTIRVREEGMGVQLRWKFVGRYGVCCDWLDCKVDDAKSDWLGSAGRRATCIARASRACIWLRSTGMKMSRLQLSVSRSARSTGRRGDCVWTSGPGTRLRRMRKGRQRKRRPSSGTAKDRRRRMRRWRTTRRDDRIWCVPFLRFFREAFCARDRQIASAFN